MDDQKLSGRRTPKIAITMGYAAGIGPELIVKTLSKPEMCLMCRPLVIGDSRILQKIAGICGVTIEWNKIGDAGQAEFKPGLIDLIDLQNTPINDFEWGKVIPSLGKASGEYLEIAWKAAIDRKVEGIVSGVLHKEALNKGGYPFGDELEFFSRITGSPKPFLVGVTGNLWTIPVTCHIPFKKIPEKITEDNVLFHIKAINQVMRNYGLEKPRIAVAALNVHGGEGGLFGDEKKKAIQPAISEACCLGIDASGPYPADTIFVRVQNGEFDSIVGMYHDQINIGRKLIGGMKGVTLFMGLPVPCGTTAHGTALGKAGKGIADFSSMEAAIKIVSRLA
jgi:4-hydroxy-L-threonine phosphate dehydrogenase PdxA